MTYNTHTLPSGLRIIHLPATSPVVYCGIAVAAGTRHEAPDEQGLAHFCEHMTFKGTEKRSSLQVINTLERVGGELNAFTSKEDTFFYATVLREYFTKAVDLLTDIVFHSQYPQSEIVKEVEVVCDEIESYNDSPSELIYDEFENQLFRNTPLGHNILGVAERVRQFTTADCKAFTSRFYTPDNAIFYVIGDIDFKALTRRLETKLTDSLKNERKMQDDGATTTDSKAPITGSKAPIAGSKTAIADRKATFSAEIGAALTSSVEETIAALHSSPIISKRDTHQAHVIIGTTFPKNVHHQGVRPLDDAHFEAFIPLLINNILGGPSMNSRLNLSLRERRGLVYSVDSSMVSYKEFRLWTTYFGCDPKDAKRCLALVRKEIDRLRRAPMSPSALLAAKKQLKGQMALATENRENYAIDMAKQFLHRGYALPYPVIAEKIDAISADELQAFVTQYLSDERLVTMIMK